MILALDVYYSVNEASSVGVLFNWKDSTSLQTVRARIENVEEYIPGEFYRRELPCLLKVIDKIKLSSLEAILVDGYVYVDDNFKLGLGGRLWEALNKKIPVIGVAKTSFHSNKKTVKEIFRGKSKNPLYVSCIGMDMEEAAEKIQGMSGNFRMPSILKHLDIMTKEV